MDEIVSQEYQTYYRGMWVPLGSLFIHLISINVIIVIYYIGKLIAHSNVLSLPNPLYSSTLKPQISFLSMGIHIWFCKFGEKFWANQNPESLKVHRINLKRVTAAWNLCWSLLESTTIKDGTITKSSSWLEVF